MEGGIRCVVTNKKQSPVVYTFIYFFYFLCLSIFSQTHSLITFMLGTSKYYRNGGNPGMSPFRLNIIETLEFYFFFSPSHWLVTVRRESVCGLCTYATGSFTRQRVREARTKLKQAFLYSIFV